VLFCGVVQYILQSVVANQVSQNYKDTTVESGVIDVPVIGEVITRIVDPDAVSHDKTIIGNTAVKVSTHVFDPDSVEEKKRAGWADTLAEKSPRFFDSDNAELKRTVFGEIFVTIAPRIFEKKDDDEDGDDEKDDKDDKKSDDNKKSGKDDDDDDDKNKKK